MNFTQELQQALDALRAQGNLRRLPRLEHDGRYVTTPDDGRRMLNLSSNDYLGLAADTDLRREFLETLTPEPTSSSSRLLTGNFRVYDELEDELARRFGTEAALMFNCGYHANTGILPAVADAQTLILADKLVHASLIDGIRLAAPARCIRYRHNDLAQLERLVSEHSGQCHRLIVVTESVFSMDGDRTDLRRLVALKRRYDNVLLYVDEAHAFGVFGPTGLGCAEPKKRAARGTSTSSWAPSARPAPRPEPTWRAAGPCANTSSTACARSSSPPPCRPSAWRGRCSWCADWLRWATAVATSCA